MAKLITTDNLTFLLQTLKEDEYFFSDSLLVPVKNDISNLLSTTTEHTTKISTLTSNVDDLLITTQDNSSKIDSLLNDSGLDIKFIHELNSTPKYQFDLYSNIDSNKTVIATGSLFYDTISNNDGVEIVDKIKNDI